LKVFEANKFVISQRTEKGSISPLVGLLGFGIAFPWFLIPSINSSPRLLDFVLMAVLLVTTIKHRVYLSQSFSAALLLLFGCLVTATLAQGLTTNSFAEISELVFWGRWYLVVLVAAPIAVLVSVDSTYCKSLVVGICLGVGLHIITLWFASAFGASQLLAYGLASPRGIVSWATGESRITTIAEHPNFAMALIGLGPAAALAWLNFSKNRLISGALLLAMLLCFVLGFLYTLSRAATFGLISAIAISLLSAFFSRSSKNSIPLLLLLLLSTFIGVALLDSNFELGRAAGRFDLDKMVDNMSGRLLSISTATHLISLNFFGVGWDATQNQVTFENSIASHNGYLFAARTVGVPMAVTLYLGTCLCILKSATLRPLAVYVFTIMHFEDLMQGGSFICLVCILSAVGFLPRKLMAQNIGRLSNSA
jgi:hypothetical protein